MALLRGFLGKIFGREGEIQELRLQVRELSWDSSYGMWTRNAFLQFCHVMLRDVRRIIFIDMNKIHTLNEFTGSYRGRSSYLSQNRVWRFLSPRSVGSRQDND